MNHWRAATRAFADHRLLTVLTITITSHTEQNVPLEKGPCGAIVLLFAFGPLNTPWPCAIYSTCREVQPKAIDCGRGMMERAASD